MMLDEDYLNLMTSYVDAKCQASRVATVAGAADVVGTLPRPDYRRPPSAREVSLCRTIGISTGDTWQASIWSGHFAFIINCCGAPFVDELDVVGRYWNSTMLSDYKRNDVGDTEMAWRESEKGLVAWTSFLADKHFDDNVVETVLDCADLIYVGGVLQRVKEGRKDRVSTFAGETRQLFEHVRCIDYGGVCMAMFNAVHFGDGWTEVQLSEVIRAMTMIHDLGDFRYDLHHGSELNVIWIASSTDGADAYRCCCDLVRGTLDKCVGEKCKYGVVSILGTAVWPLGSFRHQWLEAYGTLTGCDWSPTFNDTSVELCTTQVCHVLDLDCRVLKAIMRDDRSDRVRRSEVLTALQDYVHGRRAVTTANIRETLVAAISDLYETKDNSDLLWCLAVLGTPVVQSDLLEVLGNAYRMFGPDDVQGDGVWI